jgi:putative oxidoreductase
MDEKEARVYRIDALGITILRVVIGIVFVIHGGQKLFVYRFAGVARNFAAMGIPLPDVSAVAVTLVEFLCGLLLIVGLFTTWAALLLAIDMAVAIVAVHLRNGFFLPQGFEYALTLLAANVTLAISGPGDAALDGRLKRDRIFP